VTGRPTGSEESSLPLRERRKPRTRRDLADTALCVFLERGYHEVTRAFDALPGALALTVDTPPDTR
jgi:hypothetical protein